MIIGDTLRAIYSDLEANPFNYSVSISSNKVPAIVSTCNSDQKIVQACKIIMENSFPPSIGRKYIIDHNFSPYRNLNDQRRIYLLSYNDQDSIGNQFDSELLRKMKEKTQEYLLKLSQDWQECNSEKVLTIKESYRHLNDIENLTVFEHPSFGQETDVLIRIILNQMGLYRSSGVDQSDDWKGKIHLICASEERQRILDFIKSIFSV